MNLWLIITTALTSFIMGSKNLSALKKIKTQNSFIYYAFAALCFITPAIGFSFIFLNIQSSMINGIFFGLAIGIVMAIPACFMQFYYKKNNN